MFSLIYLHTTFNNGENECFVSKIVMTFNVSFYFKCWNCLHHFSILMRYSIEKVDQIERNKV